MKKLYSVLLIASLIVLSSLVTYSAEAAGIPKKAISTSDQWATTDLPKGTMTDGFLKASTGSTPSYSPIVVNDITDISSTYQALTGKNVANGYAGLDSGTKVPNSLLPTAVVRNNQTNTFGAFTQTFQGIINTLTNGMETTFVLFGNSGYWTKLQSGTLSGSNITVALPTTTTTLVGTNTTNTLTGKTMSGSSNTFTNIPKSAIPATTVYNDQANTYTAGSKQTFQSSSTSAGVNFPGVSSNPSSLSTGDLWRDSTIESLKLRGSSSTYTILSNNTLAQTTTRAGPYSTTLITAQVAGLNIQFTPKVTGRVLITVNLDCHACGKTNTIGAYIQVAYGPGTAPSAIGAPPAGAVPVGSQIEMGSANVAMPAAGGSSVVVTGLTVGTQYWADIQFASNAAGSAFALNDVEVTIVEI